MLPRSTDAVNPQEIAVLEQLYVLLADSDAASLTDLFGFRATAVFASYALTGTAHYDYNYK